MGKSINIWKYGGIICVIISLLLKFVLNSSLIEEYYSTNFFLVYRKFFNQVISPFSFPFSYIFILLIILAVIFILLRKRHKFIFLLNFICFLWAYFLWAWGFNYERRTQDQLLQLSIAPLSTEQIINYLDIEIRRCDSLFCVKENFSIDDIKATIANHNSSWAAVQKIPIRKQPKGSLMQMGITGIYFPFTGEANYDGGLHNTRKPFVIAHEMFHALGYASESDCNFLAYKHLSSSKNTFLQYSASIELLSYLLLELRKNDSSLFNQYRQHILPKEIRRELDDIKQKHAQYQGWFSEIGDFFNDFYLKSQGIEDGVENYGIFVPMVISWKDKKP